MQKEYREVNQYEYPKYSVLDDIEKFDKEKHESIPCGYYFVNAPNEIPFKGSRPYSYVLVRYGLTEGLIKLSDIKYALVSKLSVPADFMNQYIDIVYGSDKLSKYKKQLVNFLIGGFGSRRITSHSGYYAKSVEEAMRGFYFDDRTVIPTDAKDYYECTKIKTTVLYDNYLPIFHMIIDMEAIELHKLNKKMKFAGGEISYWNTDNVTAIFKDVGKATQSINELVQNTFWDEEKQVRKYKLVSDEENRHTRGHRLTYSSRNNDMIAGLYPDKWREVLDDNANNENAMKEIVANMYCCLIVGLGGTGKSELAKAVLREASKNGKSFFILAEWNVCLRNYGEFADKCSTICRGVHAALQKQYDFIVVDEFSTCTEQHYWLLLNYHRRNPNCGFIFVGDSKQHEAVGDRANWTDSMVDSSLFKTLTRGLMVKLSKCRRVVPGAKPEDVEAHFTLCEKLANNERVTEEELAHYIRKEPRYVSGVSGKNKKYKYHATFAICYTNRRRKEWNSEMMKYHIQEVKKRKMSDFTIVPANSYDENSQEIYLYEALPLIACKNNFVLGFCNGEQFKLVKENESSVDLVCEDNREVTVPMDIFQKSFYPGYAMTSHKSQGKTIREQYLVFEWDRMDNRGRYVSCSRAQSRDDVFIIH